MTLEPLRKAEWFVQDVPHDVALGLVARYHYAGGGSNTAIFLHGLFRKCDPVRPLGVAWWLPPTRVSAEATITHKTELFPEGVLGADWTQVLSLSRLVILPEVPKNAPTFLLARSQRLIRDSGKWSVLVTFADTWRGHTGTIYRLAGWEYLGLTKAQEVWTDVAGRMICRKAGPKTRTRAEMEALGYVSQGKHPKHKFRLVLPPGRPARERTLFGAIGGDNDGR